MNLHLNTQHLIEQAANPDRVPYVDGCPLSLRPSDLERWRRAILNNAPSDWRFTGRGRDFSLTVVTDEHQIKFVGNSWRHTQNCRDLTQGVWTIARDIEEGRIVNARLLEDLAETYLGAECDPDAEINHELKSVLATHMAPVSGLERMNLEKKLLLSQNRGNEPIVISQSQFDRNLAQRPNAILIDVENRPVDLWVRQGHPYVCPIKGVVRSRSFCVFARLTRDGLVDDVGHIWEVSPWGRVEHCGEAFCASTPRPIGSSIPDDYRSESYWLLPLAIDNWRYDLEYRIRKDSSARTERCLFAAINLIREHARLRNWLAAEIGDSI